MMTTDVETKPSRVRWLTAERAVSLVNVVVVAFVAIYLVTSGSATREFAQCQAGVNTAILSSLTASRTANTLRDDALDDTIDGLLRPEHDTPALLAALRDARAKAAQIRNDNPLPSPQC